MTPRVDVAFLTHAELGEGPVWDPRHNELLWVDCTRGQVHRFDPVTGHDVAISIGVHVGAVAWRRAGDYVVAADSGFMTVDDAGAVTVIADAVPERCGAVMNDGACDISGRFWAGTTSPDREPTAGLYRLDGDHTVTRVVSGVRLSNGIGWSPDSRLMYYVDSRTQGLDVFEFDVDDGAVRNRRRLVDIDANVGIPDGLAIDVEGCVWLALWGPGLVRRYTPRGDLDREVSVPTSHTTSCGFGGPALDVLYITSARFGLSEQQRQLQRHAGSVFAVVPGVHGLPSYGYAE
jgi:sugar lactone lactonase YvrE